MKEKIMAFLNKHLEMLCVLALFGICYLLFFYNMGAYPLIDVDETRYVQMAKEMVFNHDFLTLKLNGEYFFEKPPLYFWIVASSFKFFHNFAEETARFPMAIIATLTVFFSYFVGKKLLNFKFGLISALILASSFEFLLLSRIAILDLLLSSCIIISLYCGFLTFFVKEKYQKYFWYLFYFFSGLGVLAKGIPALVIPFGVMFFSCLMIGKLKEFFKPKHIFVGALIFFLVSLPWHIAMLKQYGNMFFAEYIIKHHLNRFVNSEGLGRKQPFLFYIPVFIAGFIPWIASFCSCFTNRFKKFIVEIKIAFAQKKVPDIKSLYEQKSTKGKFVILNSLAFWVILLFFSVSSTKLPTYILPMFMPAAFLCGVYWYDFIFENKNNNGITISTLIFNSLLVMIGIAAIFAPFFVPADLKSDIFLMQPFVVFDFVVFQLLGLFFLQANMKKALFATYVAFMIAVVSFATTFLFNFITTFGEDDLIKFATISKNQNAKLATYDFGRRYSILFYHDSPVDFITDPNERWLKSFLDLKFPKYVVVKNKNIDSIPKNIKFRFVEKGKKYSLITNY